jgi:nicotinamidase-related amidase
MGKKAVIVVDMLNDFVTGAIGCDRAKAIVPAVQRLVYAARENGVYVVYANDCHIKGVDAELKLWGDHAIKGTYGAEVIDELKPVETDFVVPKRRYSGFFQTDLHLLLRELGVDTVIMTGLHAHMCVRHTSADAYCWGFNIVVPKDATDSFTEEDYNIGIKYLKEVYGATITTVDDLTASFTKE